MAQIHLFFFVLSTSNKYLKPKACITKLILVYDNAIDFLFQLKLTC